MKRCGLLLGLVVISALLVATPALAYRTVSPPPPWLASNAHEMMSRAASALGVDYKLRIRGVGAADRVSL
jgi:hypothetical protein